MSPAGPRAALGALAACVLAWGPGCGSARRGLAVGKPVVLTEREADGRQVFMRHCNLCHPQGEGGLGPAINNKPLPALLLRQQVRKGLGMMPAFDEQKIPEPELDALVAYLNKLQAVD